MNDKLDDIFSMQKTLQKKLHGQDITFNQAFININCLALMAETAEALEETAWKNPAKVAFGWKLSHEFNKESFKKELIDILHFYINLCLAAGMTAEDVHREYMAKHHTNIKRREDGY